MSKIALDRYVSGSTIRGNRLTNGGERSMRWDVVALACSNLTNKRIKSRVGNFVLVAVVHLQTRRFGACSEAFHFFQREQAVARLGEGKAKAAERVK